MTLESETRNAVTTGERVKGVCKWFNNKSGYGFLTITEGDKKDSDIFVYHSSLQVVDEKQYKYLVQGEYVDFTVSSVDSSKSQGKYEYHATNVSGINGGKLMCETRNEARVSRPKSEMAKATFSSKSPSRRLVKNEKPILDKKETEQRVDVLEKDDWSEIKPKDLANKRPGRGRPPKSKAV